MKQIISINPNVFDSQGQIGTVYHITFEDNSILQLGYYTYPNHTTVLITDKSDLANMAPYLNYSRTTIKLNEMELICQEELAQQMGKYFPWHESFWRSKEEFENPTAVHRMIIKSLRDSEYFCKLFYSPVWEELVTKEYTLLERYSKHTGYGEKIVRINHKWYTVQYGYDHNNKWAKLLLLNSTIDIRQFNSNPKVKIHAEHAAIDRYFAHCHTIARKYGIKLGIAVRCFNGNEISIQKFSKSLKKAIGKEFDRDKLKGSRAQRRAEINKLGIDIGKVDPNHITPYILKCLEAGKIEA